MAYSHYWYRPARLRAQTQARIIKDLKPLFGRLREIVPLAISDGEYLATYESIVLASGIFFNGYAKDPDYDGDGSHESFVFPWQIDRLSKRSSHDKYSSLKFDCCKTARKPYDIAVQTVLIVISHHLNTDPAGVGMIVNSDGEDAEWEEARCLVFQVLGYGADFHIGDPKEPELPRPKPKANGPGGLTCGAFDCHVKLTLETAIYDIDRKAYLCYAHAEVKV